MPGKSYLHPSQRNMKTEQIGPSTHKNEYHVGVLDGNWFEERYAFGKSSQSTAKFDGRTITKDSFPPRSSEEYADARSNEIVNTEAPRALLFGHGQGSYQSMVSVNELSYRDLNKTGTALKVGQVTGVEAASDRQTISEKKKKEWDDGSGTNRFRTTKNVTHDATAENMKGHFVVRDKASTRHGEFVKSLGSPMYRSGLRDGY